MDEIMSYDEMKQAIYWLGIKMMQTTDIYDYEIMSKLKLLIETRMEEEYE